MCVYISYVELKKKYLDAQQIFDEILVEKENLFSRAQPKSPNLDKVGTCSAINVFDAYLIAKEQAKIDERLKEVKLILEDRRKLLTLKENELFQSKYVTDKVFKMRYMEHCTIPHIASSIHLSRSQVYRILDDIKKELQY